MERRQTMKLYGSLQDNKTTCSNEGQISPKHIVTHQKSLPTNYLRPAPSSLLSTKLSVSSFDETDITTKIMSANRCPLPLIRHRTPQDISAQPSTSLSNALKIPATYKARSQPSSPVTKTVVSVKCSLSDGNLSDNISSPKKPNALSSPKVGGDSYHSSQSDSDDASAESDFVTEDDLLSLSPTIGDKLPFLTVQLGLTLSDWDKARMSFKLPDTQALYILRLWYNKEERKMSELNAALSHCGLAKLENKMKLKERPKESTDFKASNDSAGKKRSPVHKPLYSRTISQQLMRPAKNHTPLHSRCFSLQREDGGIKSFVRQNQMIATRDKERAIMKQEYVEEPSSTDTD